MWHYGGVERIWVDMRAFEVLQELWEAGPVPLRVRGRVCLLVRRLGDEIHEQPPSVALSPIDGMEGDRWMHGGSNGAPADPEAQLTLMNVRAAELVADGEHPLHMPGDNVLVDLDLAEEALPVGTRLRIGGAIVEISAKPHLGCKKFAARFGPGALRWVNVESNRPRRLRGVNCRIVEGGAVAVGDPVEVLPAGLTRGA